MQSIFPRRGANMTKIKQCDKCGSTSNKGQWYYAYLEIKSRYIMCKQCFFKYLVQKMMLVMERRLIGINQTKLVRRF